MKNGGSEKMAEQNGERRLYLLYVWHMEWYGAINWVPQNLRGLRQKDDNIAGADIWTN